MGKLTRIGKDGRIVIPAEYRKELGFELGDEVLLFIDDGELHVATVERAIKYSQDLVRKYIPEDRNLVDELIQQRREEAARE